MSKIIQRVAQRYLKATLLTPAADGSNWEVTRDRRYFGTMLPDPTEGGMLQYYEFVVYIAPFKATIMLPDGTLYKYKKHFKKTE